MREETKPMSSYGIQTETQGVQRSEGVVVTGEAVRALLPEIAEFLVEITAGAPTAAQALRDNQLKSAQVAQAVAALGVQPADVQTISLNVYNLYSQSMPAVPAIGAIPQIAPAAFGLYPAVPAVPTPEVQFGNYQARKTLRVSVREPARVGEVVDAAVRTGATVASAFSFRVSDEAAARRAALEAAAKDARSKAEAMATAAGKQLGDPIAVSEDVIATNGAYNALRAAAPFAFGAGAPQMTGELEYYARVSARFRFQ